jgi:peptidyl-prolyl cis-trans isomerase NIMA-interacting 1
MSTSRGVPYFFNKETQEAVWAAPPGLSEQELAQLPGAELIQGKSNLKGGPDKVRASHLLIKHSGSRRPSSWKEVRVSQVICSSPALM